MDFHTKYFEKASEAKKPDSTTTLDAARKAFLAQIPTVTLSAKEVTQRIQQVQPDYYFQTPSWSEARGRNALTKEAQTAVLDTVDSMLTDPDCLAGKTIFHEDPRETGYHIAAYIKTHMGKDNQETLSELRELAKGTVTDYADAKNKLQQKVFKHLTDHLDEYLNDFKNLDDKALVKQWKTILPVLKLGDTENSVDRYGCFTEQEKLDLRQKLGPLQTLFATLSKRMDMIASPLYAVMDPSQLKNVSPEKAQQLQDSVGKLFQFQGAVGDDSAEQHEWSPFKDLSTAHGDIASKVTETVREQLQIDPQDKTCKGEMITDLDGNEVDLKNELLGNGRPVYVLPNGRPDLLPVLAYVDDKGNIYTGEDAADKFINAEGPKMPTPPDESQKPTGIWDSICKFFGWESLRSDAARKYDAAVERYQVEMAAYDKKLTDHNANDTYRDNLTIATKDEPAKRKTSETIRKKMISSTKHMTVEQYAVKTNLVRKEKQVLDMQVQKERLFSGKINALRDSKTIPKDQKLTNAQNSILKAQREKNSNSLGKMNIELFKGNADADFKAKCIATSIVCRIFDNCVFDGLKAKLAQEAPSEAFEELLKLDSDALAEKTDKLIENLAKTDNAKRAAAELSAEDIDLMCAPTLDNNSNAKIQEVMQNYNLVPTEPSGENPQRDLTNKAELTNNTEPTNGAPTNEVSAISAP